MYQFKLSIEFKNELITVAESKRVVVRELELALKRIKKGSLYGNHSDAGIFTSYDTVDDTSSEEG